MNNEKDPWGSSKKSGMGVYDRRKDFFSHFHRKFKNPMMIFSPILLIIMILGWGASGIYIINPDEKGVELLFGKFKEVKFPGLRYHLPKPIGEVRKVRTDFVNKEDIGGVISDSIKAKKSIDEVLILTADENLVTANFSVQWDIVNPYQFLFSVNDTNISTTISSVSEAALRESIAQMKLSALLTGEGRSNLLINCRARIQEVLDQYHLGVRVLSVQLKRLDPPTDVVASFKDVQTARADKEKEINSAEAYRNAILPESRAMEQKIIMGAEAKRAELIAKAEGEAKYFNSIYMAYKIDPFAIKNKMYFDFMYDFLSLTDLTFVGDGGILPFLDIIKNNKRNVGGNSE